MQLKFESKSQRIKGLSFHPIRPWILASLHNGDVQLWDYRIQTLVETFNAHEGPCRGVQFHQTQPLFVTGGDDYLIKVWNYKQRKHLFTLKGHLDYVRTVEFHPELPWILSASDDQTIRLWNWQNRCQMAILTGHSHYVMCAAFHPTKDLIVSCSLDQTLRLWDFSAIKNKYNNNKSSQQRELYGTEVEIVAVMEGHDLGVNYCAFHPNINIIISAADDRKVKLWKYTDSKAWEHDSLFGHSSNVSSCVFHPKLDLAISNSEDKTTRVWSLDRRIQVDQVKKETARFWISSVHPENYLFATGHDDGFEIYSLVQEKVPFAQIDQNQIVLAYRKQLKIHDFRTNNQYTLKTIESSGEENIMSENIKSLAHNSFDNQKVSFLVGIDQTGKDLNKYMLLSYDTTTGGLRDAKESSKGFYGLNAIFVSKSKIARLKENKEVEVYNIELDSSSNALPGLENVEKIFQCPVGKIMALTDEAVILYDINQKKQVQQISISTELTGLKNVIWNKTSAFIAFVCKKNIHIYTKNLQKLCQFSEKFNIKSMIWQKDNTLLYSTINHVKFGLLNGESGILKCTDQTLRIVKFEKSELVALDQTGKAQNFKLNAEEFALKSALFERNWDKTQNIMGKMQNLGNSVVAYLFKKKYAGLALNLVEDTNAKFSLALDSGNLDVAFEAAKKLQDKEIYKKFASEALRQGQVQPWNDQPSVEIAYRQTRQYEKLSFLYLLTGQSHKLQAMIQIASKRGDTQARFQNALYTGDVQERIKLLSEIGQIQLAYLTAVTHGYTDMAELLKNSIDNPEQLLQEIEGLEQTALVPPQPLVRKIQSSVQAQRNWPLNHIPEEYMVVHKSSQDNKVDELVEEQQVNTLLVDEENLDENEGNDQDNNNNNNENNFDVQEGSGQGEDDWPDDDDIDLPVQKKTETQQPKDQQQGKGQKQDNYRRQENPIQRNGKLSQAVGEQTAVQYFEQAFQTMKKQLGIVNYAPLKTVAMKISSNSQICVPQIPFLQSQINFIPQSEKDNNKPYVFMNIPQLSAMIQKKAYKLFGFGPSKFEETLATFKEILHSVPFVVITSQQELQQIQQLIRICLEYIYCIKLQLAGKSQQSRTLELTVYMGLCNLQNLHRQKTITQAQNQLFKSKNYIYCAYFAKKLIRMLENSDKQDIVEKSKRILQECENNGSNASKLQIDEAWLYDEDFVLQIDGGSFQVIEGNSIKCPFCGAKYDKKNEGKICNICEIAKIGQEVLGLKVQQ